jgi:hypothetical protein
MQKLKQRYELPENLWPLWGIISWHHHEGLEDVDPTGFVSTEEQYAEVEMTCPHMFGQRSGEFLVI